MDQSPATRQSLIVKLRDPADSGAWSEFVALYEPLIYRLARRKGLQDADAKDLCQEVFRAVAGVGRSMGPGPRQLPRVAFDDCTQPDDQLPHPRAARHVAAAGRPACKSCSRPIRPTIHPRRPCSITSTKDSSFSRPPAK